MVSALDWPPGPIDATGTATGVAIVVGMPRVVRNWVRRAEPLLISTGFEDVWKGNNVAASGWSFVGPGTTVFDVASPDLRAQFFECNELQVNFVFARETLSFIQQSPDQFASLVVRKYTRWRMSRGRHRWGIEPLVLLISARGLFTVGSWLRGAGLPQMADVTSSQRKVAQNDQRDEQR